MDYLGVNGTPLDREQYDGAWHFYRTNNIAVHCVSILTNAVLAGGICYQTQKCGFLETNKRDEYIRTHLEQFTRAAFDWIVCVGVVPVVTRYHPDVKEMLPEIPSSNTVSVTVNRSAQGQTIYSALIGHTILTLSKNSNEIPVFVWSGCDFLPDSTGRILTPICSLEESQRLLHFWIETTQIAAKLASNPVIITQSRPQRTSEVDGVVWNVDDDTVCAAEQARVDRLEKIAEHQYSSRAKIKQSWTTIDFGHKFDEALCKPKEHYLPEDRDLVRGNAPTPPLHLMEMLRWADERIYAAFGVPPGLFSTTGQLVKNNASVDTVFQGQVRRLRRQIETCLNDSLALCASRSEFNKDSDDHSGEDAIKEALPSDASLCKEKEKDDTGENQQQHLPHSNQIRKKRTQLGGLKLEPVSCATPEEAINWFRQGFLTYEEADISIRVYAGLPMSDISSHQRLLDLTEYNSRLPNKLIPKDTPNHIDCANKTQGNAKGIVI
jgi:hypothetical protein